MAKTVETYLRSTKRYSMCQFSSDIKILGEFSPNILNSDASFLKRKTWQRRDNERQNLYHHVKKTPLIKTGYWFDDWGCYEYEWRNLGADFEFNLLFDSIKSIGLISFLCNRKL